MKKDSLIDKLRKKGTTFQKKVTAVKDVILQIYALNLPQMLTYDILTTYKNLEVLVCEWGRGTGKTAMEGILIGLVVERMPRAKWGIYAPSYEKFFEDELPSIKYSLEKIGLFEGTHYYVGRKAPASRDFDEAYQSPDQYKHCIHFYNGTTFQILSESKSDAAVGLNLDGLIVTEAVYCNIEKLERKVFPTVRGSNVKAFENCNLFCLKAFFSTTNIDNKGRWFTDLGVIAQENPDRWAYVKCSTKMNLENLKKGYLEDAKKLAQSETIYNAEYLCVKPPLVEDAFYSLLNIEKHGYQKRSLNTFGDSRDDTDCNTNLALTVGVDFGATIISASVAQVTKDEIRFINSFYSLSEQNEIQDDLAHRIGKYYQYHERKYIVLCYDAQGNHATGNTRKTRAQQFGDILKQYGFVVTSATKVFKNPEHEAKMLLWQKIMDDTNFSYPRFRINTSRASSLFVSMQNTPCKRSANGKISKDKSSERRLGKASRHLATDLGDSADYIVTALYLVKMIVGTRKSSLQG